MTGLKERAIHEVTEAHAAGFTVREAATLLDYTPPTIYRYAKALGLTFPAYRGVRREAKEPKPQHDKWAALRKTSDPRSPMMAALYRDGYTLKEIGKQYAITRERVRQILTKYHGINAKDGGQTVRAERKREKVRRSRDNRFIAKYGCTVDQWREIARIGHEMRAQGRGLYQTPLRAFCSQRANASRRDIGWELTLWQWWMIWQQSGHWEERGRGHGYGMARFGDAGPYAIGNVEIIPSATNTSLANKKSDLPIGVHKRGRLYVARRHSGGKIMQLGSHPTPELAHAAYLAAGGA